MRNISKYSKLRQIEIEELPVLTIIFLLYKNSLPIFRGIWGNKLGQELKALDFKYFLIYIF